MGKALLDHPRNEDVRPLESLGLMNRGEDQDLAGLVALGRVHPVDVAGQQQIGDQALEALVLGGQQGELFDVGDPILGPLVRAASPWPRYPPFKIAPTAAAGLLSGSVARSCLRSFDQPREEPLALGRQKRHRLGGFERLERLAAPGKVLKNRRGLGRTNSRQQQKHPPPRGLVARVEHDPQMGEHVLDVSLLEKPQPAANRVRDAARSSSPCNRMLS